jgi:putative endopeptidase
MFRLHNPTAIFLTLLQAQFWKSKVRDAALKQLLATDVHSPGIIRGWAPERNLEEFAAAFDMGEGDKYYLPPDERGSVW